MSPARETPVEVRRLFCDAMLGGLARWLRAIGHDAAYEYGIEDGELIRRAREEDRTILTSDGPMLKRTVVRTGEVDLLYIPQQLSRFEQLRYAVDKLRLPRLASRCMSCGGRLEDQPPHTVADEVPPLAFRHCDRFWRCARCGKLFWRGTHWQKIERKLSRIDFAEA